MKKPWIYVMVKRYEASFTYDRTQNPSWAEHLRECAGKEYPDAEEIFLRIREAK